jgi:Tfp pilus assembly protein PilF
VLSELENLGLAQRTIVVLVGDHGEGLGEHGESQHAYLLYNSTQHVPLIVRCPEAVVPGTSLAEVVRTIDVPPTILALLGLPPVEQTQGVSLAGCLRGEMAVPALEAYSESFEAHAQFGVSRLRSLMDQEWKYILAPKPELYAIADSLAETNSVIAEHPDVAARLRERLRMIVAESPPPARPDSDAAATLSDADRARLESLGYAGTAVRPDEVNGPELERFEPEGANPMDFTAQFELTVQAGDLLQVRDYAAATPLLQQVLAILPDAPRPAGLVATALAAQGRPHEAIPIYERVLKLIPEDTYLRGSYGIALMQVGRTQEAADNLRIVLRENPRSARVLHNLAIALTQLGRLAEADQNLQLALEVEPQNPRVLHTLGILRARQNRLAEAEQYLVQALQIDPSFRQCQEDLERMRANMRGRQP